MREYVLRKKSEPETTRSCTPEEVRLLETADPKVAYVELLSGLLDAGLNVRCPCNIDWFVVKRRDRYLRRVRGQELKVESNEVEPCTLCVRIPHRMNDGERPAPLRVRSILIPFNSPLADTASTDLPDSGTGGGDSGLYVPTPYGVLNNILHDAGLGNWGELRWPLAERTTFSRIDNVLGLYSISPRLELSANTSWRYFSAIPGKNGNLDEIGLRLRSEWPLSNRPREAWVLGFVNQIECNGDNRTFAVSRILSCFADKLKATGGVDHGPYAISLDSAFVAAPVTRGPYLALVAFTFEPGTSLKSARLIARNAALHAVASHDLPCPVDSDIERHIVRLLRELREPFIKELVQDGDNLRVDFILPRLGVLLEVNGMIRLADYVARKSRTWPRICSSLRHKELRKVKYDVQRRVDRDELLRLLYS